MLTLNDEECLFVITDESAVRLLFVFPIRVFEVSHKLNELVLMNIRESGTTDVTRSNGSKAFLKGFSACIRVRTSSTT
jgi:hypothetical protein